MLWQRLIVSLGLNTLGECHEENDCFAFLSLISLQVYSGSIYDLATTCKWKFGRTDGSIIAQQITLSSTGKIVGYSNLNENSWGINDGNVVFRNYEGFISTRFDRLEILYDDRIVLEGRFLLVPTSTVVHTLTCLNEGDVFLAFWSSRRSVAIVYPVGWARHLRKRIQRKCGLVEIFVVRMSVATPNDEKVAATVKNPERRGQSRFRKIKTLSNTTNYFFIKNLTT